MTTRNTQTRFIPATSLQEGAGVTVHRTIGSSALRNYDPFLMLDQFNSNNPDDYIAGFPSHPHRGFSTFTYMIDGQIEHKDSMGNTGNLNPGDAQLMKAASGVIHSEMPKQKNGLMRGFQLWINLPSINKMDKPEYQEFDSVDFPVIVTNDHKVKLLIGHYADKSSPIIDDITQVTYLDVTVNAGKYFHHELPKDDNSFLYVFEGGGQLDKQNVPLNTLVTRSEESNTLNFFAGKSGVRFLVVSGKPIKESIVQYGPFVMNTQKEIDKAMQDFNSNTFVKEKAWIKRK